MWLLTIPVIIFQIFIFASITGAASNGKGSMLATAAGWTLFTLFGSIFTAGLLLLQLFTIAIAISAGSSITPKPKQETVPPPKKDDNDWIGGLVVIVVAGIWLYSKIDSKPNTPTAQPATTYNSQSTPESSYTPSTAPIDIMAGSKNIIQSAPYKNSGGGYSPRQHTKRDMSECLNLKTDAEIARCADR